jgi:hypothetical protein
MVELDRIFNCTAKLATESDVRSILGWQYPSRIRQFLFRPIMKAFRPKSLIVEPHGHYWPELMSIPHDAYLLGYWLSAKYFQDSDSVIRSDFSFKITLTGQNAEIAAQINQMNAVSLHVRRGDYAKVSQTTANQGLCSLDYYYSAIKYVAERVDNPYFFIFSDDIAWVKSNLKTDFPFRYIDHNQGIESYNDMRLMSLCKHNIIANSTFSWWGAWLNSNPDKLVVAPKAWFANTNLVSDYKQFMNDLIPFNWVKL